jgi:hypothetical protein
MTNARRETQNSKNREQLSSSSTSLPSISPKVLERSLGYGPHGACARALGPPTTTKIQTLCSSLERVRFLWHYQSPSSSTTSGMYVNVICFLTMVYFFVLVAVWRAGRCASSPRIGSFDFCGSQLRPCVIRFTDRNGPNSQVTLVREHTRVGHRSSHWLLYVAYRSLRVPSYVTAADR